MKLRLCALALSLTGFACTGQVTPPSGASAPEAAPASPPPEVPSGPGVPPTEPDPCATQATPSPGRAPMRRITVAEYDRVVLDLLGDSSQPAARLIDSERDVVNADARRITPLLAEQYLAAAEDVATRATQDLDRLLDCNRDARGEQACLEGLVDRLGPRFFRHPLTGEERAALLGVHRAVADALDYETGVRAVLEAFLQAPQFLYRPALAPEGATGVVRLDGFQIATRLSFLLWGSTPDEVLLTAAAEGELDDDVGVEAHARRMLADPRAEATLRAFFAHWLELDAIDSAVKDPEVFPDFDDRVPGLLRAETEAFITEVLRTDRSWRTLITAPWTMGNAAWAAYQGLEPPGGGEGWVRVERDPRYFSGVLTQGAVLASRDRAYETSPIHRGMFLRANLICGHMPDVPENLDTTPPDPDPTKTTRQRLAEHRDDPVCASCHRQIDPLGFALEHIDASGRFRSTENGLPIDATGDIFDSDFDGRVNGAVELSSRLVASEMAQACFAQHWFRYAFGRGEQAADACSLHRAVERFRAHEFDLDELLLGLILSDAFLYLDPAVQAEDSDR